MSRFFVFSGRFAVTALLITLLGMPGYGQISLREALDFDGDGRADFSVFRPSNNTWFVLGSSGTFLFQQWGLANQDRLVPGDYDGDNKADIAVFREGTWYVINSSNFTFSGRQWGVFGDEPVARDYDGDGKTDLAIVRRSGGHMYWWILRSTAGIAAYQFGLARDFVAPGDYDGDGKFDLCVQRPGATPGAQAYFFVQGSTVGFYGLPWGFGSDEIVPGDYDGDGKTDIAIVRPGSAPNSNLEWHILRSNGQGHFGMAFGLTAHDYNAQADYDGDGKTDIAVWRQTDGTFYVWRSSTKSISGGQWGVAGDLPIATYDTH